LMHPTHYGNWGQSLAEATIAAGTSTTPHRHHIIDEIYHVTAGRGVMSIEGDRFEIEQGDTIAIPRGCKHAVDNNGDDPLVILCACAPPYSHEDTELCN
ncbi:MAG: cupin domain-containing protein, partial [Deltaproteobacteria bacterium]|nr:cupin domain-containing protein [Deltaproteobacteria bacterium]